MRTDYESNTGVMHSRLEREARTVGAMVAIYCRGRHGTKDGLCPDCRELLAYSLARLEKCRFREEKPNCADCPVHCYKPSMREKVREVMRYAGPRMVLRHPILALFHILNGLKRPPDIHGRD